MGRPISRDFEGELVIKFKALFEKIVDGVNKENPSYPFDFERFVDGFSADDYITKQVFEYLVKEAARNYRRSNPYDRIPPFPRPPTIHHTPSSVAPGVGGAGAGGASSPYTSLSSSLSSLAFDNPQQHHHDRVHTALGSTSRTGRFHRPWDQGSTGPDLEILTQMFNRSRERRSRERTGTSVLGSRQNPLLENDNSDDSDTSDDSIYESLAHTRSIMGTMHDLDPSPTHSPGRNTGCHGMFSMTLGWHGSDNRDISTLSDTIGGSTTAVLNGIEHRRPFSTPCQEQEEQEAKINPRPRRPCQRKLRLRPHI
ncbi:hypothetical protein BGZ91_000482 [Linnemannia elongata]|nr:hypothetical protein BGZ91_000482 [Linnemannia elongata]